MKPVCALLIASTFAVSAVGAHAQQAEPGTASTQVSPASAAPKTHAAPNLRPDSEPHTNQDASTDSTPAPETTGMDATPLMDIGLDWSLSETSTIPTVTKEIVTKKGLTSVVDRQTAPIVPLPVTNPPEPPVQTFAASPQPAVERKPLPPDPLTGIPQ